MTHPDFRLDVYHELTANQRRGLTGSQAGPFRRVRPTDGPTWVHLSDDGADPAGPVADRIVVGSVVGDDRQSAADAAEVVSLIWYAVPAAEAAEFEDWFGREHAPILLREPAWLRCRRVRVSQDTAGTDVTHLVVHELRDLSALSSPHLDEARSTPARADMAGRPWFAANVTELFGRDDRTGADA